MVSRIQTSIVRSFYLFINWFKVVIIGEQPNKYVWQYSKWKRNMKICYAEVKSKLWNLWALWFGRMDRVVAWSYSQVVILFQAVAKPASRQPQRMYLGFWPLSFSSIDWFPIWFLFRLRIFQACSKSAFHRRIAHILFQLSFWWFLLQYLIYEPNFSYLEW